MGSATIQAKMSSKNSTKQKKKTTAISRKTYIEVMRIIAAFFVIVNHTNSDVFLKYTQPLSFTWFLSLIYFYLSKISVPVFFMIMGGLLLKKIDKPKKSIERVVRMVGVTLLFSLVYYIKGHWTNPSSMGVFDFLKTMFSSRATNAYWYIYTYIGLLILLPIMQRMAKGFSKNATLYFIGISMGVLGLIPLINIFFHISPHHYITDTFFPVPIGIVFMGYYIEKYMKIDKSTFFGALLVFVAMTSFQVLFTYDFYLKDASNYLQLDNWRYLTITLSATCFYIIFKYLSTIMTAKENVAKILCYFGSLTFGIYLLSDLIISLTRKMYNGFYADMNVLLATILWEIIVFVICGVITAILKLIPGLKKLL